MPNTFTNEEYTDMHCGYGFCSANDRAAVVEYRECYPHRRITLRKILETYTEFWDRLVPSYE